jgi:hypothetical protein
MNEDEFVLTGFEGIVSEDKEMDYAQTWRCQFGLGLE